MRTISKTYLNTDCETGIVTSKTSYVDLSDFSEKFIIIRDADETDCVLHLNFSVGEFKTDDYDTYNAIKIYRK